MQEQLLPERVIENAWTRRRPSSGLRSSQKQSFCDLGARFPLGAGDKHAPSGLRVLLCTEREPGRQRSELFILRPRRAQRLAEFAEKSAQRGRPEAKSQGGCCHKIAFFDFAHTHSAAAAGMEHRVTKELSVSRMNQRMCGKNFCQFR